MKISQFLILALFIGTTASVGASVAINLNYDKVSGAYSIEGADSGPGLTLGAAQGYLWNWGSEETAMEVYDFLEALGGLNLFSGTVGGEAITSTDARTPGGPYRGFGAMPAQSGALIFDSASGTTTAGLWSLSEGTFTGLADSIYNSSSNSMTITITAAAVPEPAT